MKSYTDRDTTPLAYHHFMHYVSLPLSFLSNAGELASLYASMYYVYYYKDILTFHYLICLALIAASFIGFFFWKPFSWYAFMALMWYNLLSYLCFAALFSDGMLAAQGVARLVITIPISIYYIKRKPLFVPSAAPLVQNAHDDVHPSLYVSETDQQQATPPAFCRKCGSALVSGAHFCNKCGTAVIREEEPED